MKNYVKVVRCEKCHWYNKETYSCDHAELVDGEKLWDNRKWWPDDFCSKGETWESYMGSLH